MTDYTKLVQDLRVASMLSSAWEQLFTDAADAIEELKDMPWVESVQVDKLRQRIDELEETACHCNVRENAELIAKILDDDVDGKVYQMPKREEVWKDVIGYEGLYQVSDQARVRNNKGKILKQSVKVGKCVYYKYVKLYKDGQYRQGYVHRMMAECFIPNPDNLPIINHKDEDGTNNRLDNLEWCTVEYNSNYGNAKRNMSRGKRRRAKMEVQE